MIIELAGVSGSGKTTLGKTASAMMKRRGFDTIQLRKLAWRELLEQDEADRLFADRYPGATEALLGLPKRRSPERKHAPLVRQLWMSSQPFLRDDLAVIFDEGFFHRAAYLAAAGGRFEDYVAALELAPKADVILLANVPLEVAEDRVVMRMEEHRREKRRYRFRAMADVNRGATEYMAKALPLMEKMGVVAAGFDGEQPFRAPMAKLSKELAAKFPAGSGDQPA